MRIAILSTPWIPIPPIGYGGIELVVANLTTELINKGHQVFLHATGDSITQAKLSYYYEKAIGNILELKNNSIVILPHIHSFFQMIKKEKVDIIHNNCQYEPIYFCDLQNTPFVHTLHGAFYKGLKSPSGTNEKKRKILTQFKNHPYISISNNQRTGLPELNYIKTIYNGIDTKKFSVGAGKGGYLAYLGRITPNKGVDIAIKIANKLNKKIKIAAFVDKGDMDYFKKEILPLANENVEFIGEIKSDEEKNIFFGNAEAMLFPIRWNEPFGLVMVEAMASGTPIIAFNKGSVSEIVINNKTGYVVDTEEEMLNTISQIDIFDRQYISQYAKNKFGIDQMVNNYIEAYNQVISNWNEK